MKKPSAPITNSDDVWSDSDVTTSTAVAPETPDTKIQIKSKSQSVEVEPLFDLEGLMTDFPTAKELERFVYDQTGLVLNLKGRANKLKYQVAMDALNHQPVDPAFLGDVNPYLDKVDMIPEEPIKPTPARDSRLPEHDQVQNSFYSPFVPHPNAEYRGRGRKCQVIFRKYRSGEISYEVIGPIDQYTEGTKIDKYGRERPEIIKYIDPRTGEQMVQTAEGVLTEQGRRLKVIMQTLRINNTTHWDVWIDRSFGSMNGDVRSNPWLD
jgi:hypothetical protein